MRTVQDLVECVMSVSVELGGQTAERGGFALMKSAARKIGWASRKGGRRGVFKAHSLSGHRMATGFSARGGLSGYDPKNDYQRATMGPYHQARMCGSGCVRFAPPADRKPNHLFGRSSFNVPDRQAGFRNNPGTLPLKHGFFK